MKTTILNFFGFCGLVLLLGAQTLLRGSWTIDEPPTVRKSESMKDQ